MLGLTYAICRRLACDVGWGAAGGHLAKDLPSSRAREYRRVDVVEDYVRFSRPTAEELDLLPRGTDIVRNSSCTIS